MKESEAGKTKPPTNVRKALAGAELLGGTTLKAALIKAGYAPTTAHNPTSNGLGADRCLEAAREAGMVPDSATLRDQARRVLGKKLGQLEHSEDQLKRSRAGEIARIVEVTEKFHGDRGHPEGAARPVAERLLLFRQVVAIMQERGLLTDTDGILVPPVADHGEQGSGC